MKMKQKIRIGIKFLAFVSITCMCVGLVNEWLKPEYYYNETWPTTNTYEDFYRLEKNSADVLILGSSHAVSCINPQIIYDNYGITSYNLGCGQQSVLVTYYWLREALKYQSPKAVILETYTFHKYYDNYVYNDLNCSETAVRKAMDVMRLSPLKWEAGKAIEEVDHTQIGLSFPLLNIRYHTRWTCLGENDFTEEAMIDHGGVKGYTALGTVDASIQYTPFRDADAKGVEAEEMVDVAKTYLDKIVGLCKKENIELILVNIPCNESIKRYKSTKEYADKNGITFYDFNEERLYNEIEYNVSEDFWSHPNYKGAEKVSNYLGKELQNTYGIKPRKDDSFDESRKVYEHKIENIKLSQINDINQYLDMINNDKYTVFIWGPISYADCINDEIMKKLYALGFTTDLRKAKEGIHYFAKKDSDGVIEKYTKKDFSYSGSFRSGYSTYKCVVDTTNMLQQCKMYSLVVDGTECGNQNVGLNIVVYDNDFKMIVDKVNVNTTIKELTITRY